MPNSMNRSQPRAQQQVAQRLSTNSPDVEEGTSQLSFLGAESGKRPSAPVDMAYLLTLPSLRRAIAYSLNLADMDPKEAYGPLGMDKSTWSRILGGQQEVPASILKPLRVLTGNDAPQQWQAHDWGCELKPLRTELQQRLEAEQAAHSETRRELDTMVRLFRETR